MEGYSYNHNSILEKYDNVPTTNSKKLVNSGDLKNYIDAADNLVDAKVDDMIDRVANPFTFKGTVNTLSNLPSSGNTVNDTYFVTDEGFMYTWNGTSFDKTSTDVNNQLARDIATPYDGTKADYKAGDIVLENNQTYVRKQDATSAEGTFVSANWTATSIGDVLSEEITDLKSALDIVGCKTIDNTNSWESGSYNSTNGENLEMDTRIRMKSFIGVNDNILGVKSTSSYKMTVFAWNQEGVYVGTLGVTGEFSKTVSVSDIAAVTEFSFASYQDYKFKIALRNAEGTSSINTYDSINCMYVYNITSEIENINEALLSQQLVDFSSQTTLDGIVNSSYVWAADSGFQSYKIPVMHNDKKIIVNAQGVQPAFISFVQNVSNLVNGQQPSYCIGTLRITVAANKTLEMDIPNDCNYIIVNKTGTSSIDYTPVSMSIYSYLSKNYIDSEIYSLNNVIETPNTRVKTVENWSIGSFTNPYGDYYASTSRIRTDEYYAAADGILSVYAETGYEIFILAWNLETGEYVGELSSDGTWKDNETDIKWVTEFNLTDYPSYKFKFVLRNAADPTASIIEIDGSNLKFIKTAASYTESENIKKNVLFETKINGADLTWSKLAIDEDGSLITPQSPSSNVYCITSNYISTDKHRYFIYTGPVKSDGENLWVRLSEYLYEYSNTFIKRTLITPFIPFELSKNCSYIRLSILHDKSSGVFMNVDDGKYFYGVLTHGVLDEINQDEEWKQLGLHCKPDTKSALNIVKNCRQMTDIKWTPATDLPRLMMNQWYHPLPDSAEQELYEGVFKAGVEYKGIPYGRCVDYKSGYGYSNTYVGINISFETFITSVGNEESMINKESVFNLSDHRSIPYAAVCSALTCYGLGVPWVPTANIPNISGLKLIGKINDNGILLPENNFHVGCVLNLQSSHTATITDIIKDADGHITTIELSDASPAGLADRNYDDGQLGGVCRRKGWTIDQIYTYWGEYSLYVYTNEVAYTPSPYVDIGNEFDMIRYEHFPIMPYEGNKFSYKVGYVPNNRVKLLISVTDYGYVRVFKDNSEISGSPFAITSETTSIDITEISAGNYIAYLCDMSNGNIIHSTVPCNWAVVS